MAVLGRADELCFLALYVDALWYYRTDVVAVLGRADELCFVFDVDALIVKVRREIGAAVHWMAE